MKNWQFLVLVALWATTMSELVPGIAGNLYGLAGGLLLMFGLLLWWNN
jgi:hypothetical protein